MSIVPPPPNTPPRVDVAAPKSPLPVAMGTTSVGVLSATDELMSYRDLDVVLKRAVELARDRIGLERAAILLLAEGGTHLCGTFGTDLSGTTRDERSRIAKLGLRHKEAITQASAGVARWMMFKGPATDGSEERAEWTVLTPILGRKGPVGIMMNDSAITGSSMREGQQVEAAIFARLLGGIIFDLRKGSEALPWESLLARVPRVGDDDRDSLVVSVVHALHEDPSLSARALAKKFAVSASKLGHVFKDAMGIPLVDYKNRLRVERFLTLVQPGGGNLMQAALDAGFGSYAQFHRVFRDLMGKSPRDYITGREE